jgi:hypothetical protein
MHLNTPHLPSGFVLRVGGEVLGEGRVCLMKRADERVERGVEEKEEVEERGV